MPVRRVLLPVALLLTLAVPVAAQGIAQASPGAPDAGTWGAESVVGRFGDAKVLRFLSPSWVLLVGGSIRSTNDAGTGSARVSGRTDVTLQAGIRKYHRSGLGFRPVTGVGVTYGRIEGFSTPYGAYGEAGGAYLFNRHLSLGAVAVAEFSRDGDRNTFALAVPRVMASVFF